MSQREVQSYHGGEMRDGRGPQCSMEEQNRVHAAKISEGATEKTHVTEPSLPISPSVHSAKKVRKALKFDDEISVPNGGAAKELVQGLEI
ncbi:unnamed protein product [Microthlaspi erraticum]|uniref:Uncharacterized protein n=1 Tax=Microthlaspi erraticum TaxID=1685480 RepID=A0A6D2L105_9BRAS|nr:unnamed protein product [Microthlaspi erraticum]